MHTEPAKVPVGTHLFGDGQFEDEQVCGDGHVPVVVTAEVKFAQNSELPTQKEMSEHHTMPAERHVVHVECAAAVQSSRSKAVVATESKEEEDRQPETVFKHAFDFQQ